MAKATITVRVPLEIEAPGIFQCSETAYATLLLVLDTLSGDIVGSPELMTYRACLWTSHAVTIDLAYYLLACPSPGPIRHMLHQRLLEIGHAQALDDPELRPF